MTSSGTRRTPKKVMNYVLEYEGNVTKPAAYVGLDFIHTKFKRARKHLRIGKESIE